MFRKALVVSALVVLAPAALAVARSGDRNATGSINDVRATQSSASVTGITSKGKLWLGCTVIYRNGRELDLAPKKVKGRFHETFTLRIDPEGIDKVIVALWRWKVDRSECAKAHGGKPCIYCERNGYHMAENLDRAQDTP